MYLLCNKRFLLRKRKKRSNKLVKNVVELFSGVNCFFRNPFRLRNKNACRAFKTKIVFISFITVLTARDIKNALDYNKIKGNFLYKRYFIIHQDFQPIVLRC